MYKGIRVAAVGVLLFIAAAAPAWAAPGGYPGTTTSTTSGATEETQDAGRLRPGDSIVVESCGYTPETAADVTYDDKDAGHVITDRGGCAHVSVEVLESCPEVNVNDHRIDGKRGANRMDVAGLGANNQPRTVHTKMVVTCSKNAHDGSDESGAAAPDSGGGGGGGASTESSGQAQLAGAVRPSPGAIASAAGASGKGVGTAVVVVAGLVLAVAGGGLLALFFVRRGASAALGG